MPVQLMGLQLAGNPLTCDCKLAWVQDWLKHVKAESMPLMMTINNFNNNKSRSLSQSGSAERMEDAVHSMRQAECIRSGTSLSLLHVFRNELRDCRTNSATSYLDPSLLPYISLLLVSHFIFSPFLNYPPLV